MKEIKLSEERAALVDDEDFSWLTQWYWGASYQWGNYYAVRYIKINGHRTSLQMHREIMKCPKGLQVDHINHNGLDNRRCNLRICTHQENHRNKLPKGKYPYLGICKRADGRLKCWHARINYNKKGIDLGSYYTLEDAARAYDKAAKEYFGEFANLNFPNE